MSNALAQFLVFMGAIVTVALVAVLVSKNSNAPALASSFFGGVAQDLTAATSPVTGASSGVGNLFGSSAGGLINLGI